MVNWGSCCVHTTDKGTGTFTKTKKNCMMFVLLVCLFFDWASAQYVTCLNCTTAGFGLRGTQKWCVGVVVRLLACNAFVALFLLTSGARHRCQCCGQNCGYGLLSPRHIHSLCMCMCVRSAVVCAAAFVARSCGLRFAARRLTSQLHVVVAI